MIIASVDERLVMWTSEKLNSSIKKKKNVSKLIASHSSIIDMGALFGVASVFVRCRICMENSATMMLFSMLLAGGRALQSE